MPQITHHAITRYQERVKPALSREACRRELEALCEVAPFLAEDPYDRLRDDQEVELREVDGWLELAPNIYGILAIQDERWTLLTVLAGSISAPRRERRNDAKAAMRRRRQRERRGYIFKGGQRRHRLVDWQ